MAPLVPKQKKAQLFFLEGSEKTKSVEILTSVLNKIFSSSAFELNKKTKVVVVGGGTLGDFGGFIAHILKRGLDLVLVPSTWLSAMDSSHGGKNGINFGKAKNQLGTIYPAKQVILVKSLLEEQPVDRKVEGFGELIKIAYIHSPTFFRKVASERLNKIDLYSYLSVAIDAKYKIVKKDPFETKGIRYILNLGHTMAHVWEVKLGIHHGIAVLLGMYFDFLWADRRGYQVSKDLKVFLSSEIVRGVLSLFYSESLFSVSDSELKAALLADKKKEHHFIRYVFPEGASQFRIESVRLDDILKEYHRQKKSADWNQDVSVIEI